MITRNVMLTDVMDRLVQALVASGCQTASGAPCGNLRLLEYQEAG